MRDRNLHTILVVLLLSAMVAGCSALQAPSGHAEAEPGVSMAKAALAGGPSEGIKVHGNWVIEVQNPDGSLVRRSEFENALIGASTLALFLARANSPGLWAVTLQGTGPESLCGALVVCILLESADSSSLTPSTFQTLTVAANGGKVELKGSATASGNTSISKVFTNVSVCAANTAPATPCGFATKAFVTETALSSPVSVSPGQQIQVTVTISFS